MEILAVFLGVYFIPTVCAFANEKRNSVAILLLNLFLGWTFVGWVVALVWSVTKDPQPTVQQVPLTDPRQLTQPS